MEKEITEKINCAIKVYHSLNKALIIKREIIKQRKMTVQIQTNITIWERNLIIKQQTDQQTASNRNKMPDTCQMSNKMDHNNNEWQNQRKTGNRMHGKQKYKKKNWRKTTEDMQYCSSRSVKKGGRSKKSSKRVLGFYKISIFIVIASSFLYFFDQIKSCSFYSHHIQF